jgi:hypothetical protein
LTRTSIRVFLREMRVSLLAAGLSLVGGTLGFSSTASAQCTTPDASVEAPIAKELVAESGRAHTWRYVWTGINAGSMALSLAGIPILPKSETPSLVVGAGTAVVSGLFTWFWPLDVEADAETTLHLGCLTPSERDSELLRLREHSARDEASRIQWPWHVGNFVTALIPGAILWFGFDRRLDGVLASVGGFASGEIELLTQPTRLTIGHPATALAGARGFISSRGAIVTYGVAW